MSAPSLVFATEAYAKMGGELALGLDARLGQVEQHHFPDGERYRRLLTDPRGHDTVLLGGTVSEADTLELYDLASGIAGFGATRLTLAIPYFGYSTMERMARYGEIVTAKTRARLISSIPCPALRVVMLDLHTEGLPQYFEGSVITRHVSGKSLVLRLAREFGGADFVMACTDAGRAKWVESLANDLGVSASFVFKKRLDGRTTKITSVSADVSGKHVVIYDDMIRTGGSLLDAARAYRAFGATGVSAIATHGLFPDDSLRRLEASGVIDRIACTDSHPRARSLSSAFLRVEPVAELLATACRDEVGG